MEKILENKKATALVSSAPTDEKRLPTHLNEGSIPQPLPDGNTLHTVDGKTLLAADLPSLRFVVQGLLPQGLFILAGSPKVGKSWLSLLLAHEVSTGGRLWGRATEPGAVLYLALEDSLNRLQNRYKRYSRGGSHDLHFAIRASTLKDHLVPQVSAFVCENPTTRLVIIDTLQQVRGKPTDKNPYVSDYHDMNILRELTGQHDLTLLLVTHTRKLDDPDPLNRISGSTGLVGAVDGVMVLEKDERSGNSARLTVANRDTDGHMLKLEFVAAACRWDLVEEEIPERREDSLFSFLLVLLAERESWAGTATQLSQLAADYGLGFTPATLAKRLRAYEQILFHKYKIRFITKLQNNQKHITLSSIHTEIR